MGDKEIGQKLMPASDFAPFIGKFQQAQGLATASVPVMLG